MKLLFLTLSIGAGLALLSGCNRDDVGFAVPDAAERVEYEVRLTGFPDEESEALAEDTLELYRRQDDGAASPAFLRRRADNDLPTVETILQAEGYYTAEVRREVSGGNGEPLVVEVIVEPGEPFTLTDHTFELRNLSGTPPRLDPEELGSPIGARSEAVPIIEAEDAAIAALRRAGYAYARFEDREAVADPRDNTIEVTSIIDAGRPYTFGEVTFEGLRRVDEEYLRTYIEWEENETFNLATLRDFQQDLVRTRLFDTVIAEPPEEAPENGNALPIMVEVTERKRRTLSVGLRFDTEIGPTTEASIENRNLFGRNETVRFEVRLGAEERAVALNFRVPQVGRDGQNLVFGTEYQDRDEEAFEGETFTANIGLERELNDEWRAGLGLAYELSDVTESDEDQDIEIYGIPAFVDYDNTEDLLDPRSGFRARLEAAPFYGTVNGEGTSFLRVDSRASAYFPLTEDQRFVLATRARVASIGSDDVFDVPVTRRIFAGGGGSVRAFGTDTLGPEDDDGDARGGLSAIELGAEVRFPIRGNVGGVAFIEAGEVTDEVLPKLSDGLRYGVGTGIRYFSPIGPVRADIAFPLDREDNEDAFQFYLAIGQAF
ncbi:autotransporter assembly complex protein TamA [Pontivivens ytuae]|uniref:BamA/TamA family outer membrane protein n=1 Tax=Pontivivens ytuae TaxID=2789856 RepID=A0A7S9LNF9_9RHOB|nr:BamA/TamA family outer membrane protein [Pontivivens ytuae]QPH52337.1 BamA/TamA family outer membrane protein [Pontivivens ytuae]